MNAHYLHLSSPDHEVESLHAVASFISKLNFEL